MKKTSLFLLFVISYSHVLSQNFTLTPNVIVRGKPYVTEFAEIPAGGYYIGSMLDHVNDQPASNLTKVDAHGIVDAEFNKIFVDDHILKILPLADGKLLVGGWFTQINGTQVGSLVRLNANGSIDESFQSLKLKHYESLSSFYQQRSGKIVVIGSFNVSNYPDVMRLNEDGTVDNTFTRLDKNFVTFPSAVDEDENIYFVDEGLNKIDKNGNMLPGYPIQLDSDGYITHMTFSQGLLIIGGDFTLINGVSRDNIAVLNPDGSVNALQFNGLTPFSEFKPLSDGRLVVSDKNEVNLFERDGSFLEQIAQHGIENFFVDSNDNIILTGGASIHTADGTHPFVVKLKSDLTTDQEFHCDISHTTGITSVAADRNGNVLIGTNNDVAGINTMESKLVRIFPNGKIDTLFRPDIGLQKVVKIVPQFNGKILIADSDLIRLEESGTIDHSFNPPDFANYSIHDVKVRNGKIFATGFFNDFGTFSSPGIIRLNEDGSIDESFKSKLPTGAFVARIAFQSDNKIVAVGTFRFGDQIISCIRLNEDGSIDESFVGGTTTNGIWTIAIDSRDRVYLGGQFYNYNESNKHGIVRLESSGEVDITFFVDQPSMPNVTAIEILSDSAILVGEEGWYAGTALRLVDETGQAIDTALTKFDDGSSVFASSYGFGTLCLAGRFMKRGDLQVSSLAFVQYENPAKEVSHLTYEGPLTKTYGDPDFGFVVTSSSGGLPEVYSSNPDILDVINGIATIGKAGIATVRIYDQGNARYKAASAEVTITINKAQQLILFDSIPEKYTRSSFALSASSSANLPIYFSSSDETIASISESTATIHTNGEAVITASQNGDENYLPAQPVSRKLVINLITNLEEPFSTEVSVWPNPGDGLYSIDKSFAGKIKQAQLISMDGKAAIIQLSQNGDHANVDIRHFPSGVYMLNLVYDNGVAQVKIRKN